MTNSQKDDVISLLPPEILSEIILFSALPLSGSIWKTPSLSISTIWRACAINTPRVWSCIWVTASPDASERLEVWFQRSGSGCPLYLTVHDIKTFRKLETSWLSHGHTSNLGRRIHSLVFHTKIGAKNFPFPLEFDTNLCELDAYLHSRHLPTPQPLFNMRPPLQLKRLKLESAIFSPGVISTLGINPSALTTLILADEISCRDVLDIIIDAPNLEQLDWDTELQSFGTTESLPYKINLNSLLHLNLQGNQVLMHFLRTLEPPPNLQKLSLLGEWDDEGLLIVVKFASKCQGLTHLELFPDNEPPSADDVSSLLHALPKLEYFDPKWRESNIEGLLALCGEFPASAKLQQPASWACRNVHRLCLPLSRLVTRFPTSRKLVSQCLKRVLSVRSQGRSAHTSSADVVAAGGKSPSQLVFVVDVDRSIMDLMVGRKWASSRGECVKLLEFPNIQ
ncbi:hypothetical protein DL93DRAFT_2164807 [Clavulina sp. PMI_390]|nr:hypothetical protein DL93DRAFT_2164807 [Clavulina sp. PMI_390]